MSEAGPPPLPPDRFSHPAVAAFDAAAERAACRLRGNRLADRALYALSEAGTHSAIWHAIGVVELVVGGRAGRTRALRRSALLVAEEVLVNVGFKRLFGRVRPNHITEHPHGLRRPRTSSFPSGHASGGACAAVLLERDHGPAVGVAAAALAAAVGWSRVHVGAHHASDVAGGAATGVVVGIALDKLWPRPSPPSAT